MKFKFDSRGLRELWRNSMQIIQPKSNETPTWCNTVQVLFLQSHSTCFGRKRPSSSLLGPELVPALIRRCDDLPATITYVPVASILVLNTPDDGRLRPKHVEWLCRNKTCTVLHQVGDSFDLYYDARKHKIKIQPNFADSTWDRLHSTSQHHFP